MGIGAVFFDVGGVLIDADLERYAERAGRLFRVTPEAVRNSVAHRVRELERGEMDSLQFWREVGHDLGVEVRTRQVYKLWRNLLCDSLSINRDLTRLCRRLARNGVLLGVLSNVIEDHAQLLEEAGVYMPFSPCLVSCRSGLRKPDPEFYRRALQRAGGLPGRSSLMVDDNAHNLPPARTLGMHVHHFQSAEGLEAALRRLGAPLAVDRHDPWMVDEQDFPAEAGRDEQIRFLLQYAVLAPCSHNRQPWRFRVGRGQVELHPDRHGHLPSADPQDRELIISCGAAWYQLRLASRRFGLRLVPTASGGALARARVVDRARPLLPFEELQFQSIPYQRSEWVPFEEEALPAGVVTRLRRHLQCERNTTVEFLQSQAERDRVAELVLRVSREQWRDKTFRQEMVGWMKPSLRFDRGGGFALGLGRLETPLFWTLLPHVDLGWAWARREAARTRSAPLLALLTTRRDRPSDWFAAGQSLARLNLTARALGLTVAPVHGPAQPDDFRQALASLGEGGTVQLVLRLGYGPNVRPPHRQAPVVEPLG